MTLSYTYTVVEIDEASKRMDIMYSSPGYEDILVGARIPWSDESVEAIAVMYAPVHNWLEAKKQLLPVVVNTSGTISVPIALPTPTEEEIANAEMWAQIDFEQRIAKTLVKFGLLDADPTEIKTTKL